MGWFEENKRWITDINAAPSENTRIKYKIFPSVLLRLDWQIIVCI